MAKTNFFSTLYKRWFGEPEPSTDLARPKVAKKVIADVPKGRISEINTNGQSYIDTLASEYSFITPQFAVDNIKVIRSLVKGDENMGLVINDLVKLTNTGHKIKFSQKIDPETQDRMRLHLETVSKTWADGRHGITGIVDTLLSQIWISGAGSVEAVPKNDLSGIENIAFINPETIRFKLVKGRYAPYQIRKNTLDPKKRVTIKLNQSTYKYIGIGSDEEIPYGIPPFLTALKAIAKSRKMDANIDNILHLMGLLGFLEVKLSKPDQDGGENDANYKKRLDSLLDETKKRVGAGLSDGISVGYQDDHEYEFHSTTQNISGLPELYHVNQVKIANGLKTHPSFMGIDAGKSETHLSIVFTKMLSQLNSIQSILSYILEDIYLFELKLAGFEVEHVKVEFKASTITDDLKYQQAMEYKLRNLMVLYDQGIISQEQFAEESGYTSPDQKDWRVPRDVTPAAEHQKQQKKEKRDDSNDRKSRDKKKAQPKRKDQKNK